MTYARLGRSSSCPTRTMVAAWFICLWLRPPTGLGGVLLVVLVRTVAVRLGLVLVVVLVGFGLVPLGFGAGLAVGDADGEVDGDGVRPSDREAASSARRRWLSSAAWFAGVAIPGSGTDAPAMVNEATPIDTRRTAAAGRATARRAAARNSSDRCLPK